MFPKISIAYFISSHGFGHAARASAVMNAIHAQCPVFHFEIFTMAPEWFFKQSLKPPFVYHRVLTDIGLVQTSSLRFDLLETIKALNHFLPFDEKSTSKLIRHVRDSECRLIISDISPLGIAVGKAADIPTLLIENFTWDWIYQAYTKNDSRLSPIITYLKEVYESVDYHIQSDPVCSFKTSAFHAPPISRYCEKPRQKTRQELDISGDEMMVLITMGGIEEPIQFMQKLSEYKGNIKFVIPGNSMPPDSLSEKSKKVILLPQSSEFYHPDLVNASDAVVGKAGYSTVAEVYYAGVPFGYVSRSDFRESPVIESYIKSKMNGIPIAEESFHSGDWLNQLQNLLALGVMSNNYQNGAHILAEHICNILNVECEILEIVDSKSSVIGAAPRKKVHGNNQWLHRVVHVLVFDTKNRLLLQKRSMAKRVAPGKWDTSVGGHVDFKETIEQALYREMKEELGIRPDSIRFMYEYQHTNSFESELVYTHICKHDGGVIFNKDEIDEVKYWRMEEIEDSLGKGIFSENFEDEFMRYCNWIKSQS